jgi:DNA-binding LacI/PurR family transcriptional regulator
MKVTLRDIANKTGYSISTVSRVMKGSHKISDQAKDEILTSAREMGYSTPRVRNAHLSKSLLNIALVATGFHEGEFYVCFFHGLNKAAAQTNVRLSLVGILEPKKELKTIVKEVASNHYDGMILFIPEFKRADYEDLVENVPGQFPIISNALIEDPVFTTITFESYSGGHLVAKHFEERGYKTVGIIEGPVERSEARFRSNGFQDFVRQSPDLKLTWKFPGDFTFDTGLEAFASFEKSKTKPEAIFACNDSMANGFMEAAKQKRYTFPDDIALIGYDDLPVCRHNQPTISSIHTNYEELGMATMKALRERLSNTDLKTNMVSFVPVSVCKRESS